MSTVHPLKETDMAVVLSSLTNDGSSNERCWVVTTPVLVGGATLVQQPQRVRADRRRRWGGAVLLPLVLHPQRLSNGRHVPVQPVDLPVLGPHRRLEVLDLRLEVLHPAPKVLVVLHHLRHELDREVAGVDGGLVAGGEPQDERADDPRSEDDLDDGPECLPVHQDRKSTRLNSSHVKSSYAVFFLKKKTPMTRMS